MKVLFSKPFNFPARNSDLFHASVTAHTGIAWKRPNNASVLAAAMEAAIQGAKAVMEAKQNAGAWMSSIDADDGKFTEVVDECSAGFDMMMGEENEEEIGVHRDSRKSLRIVHLSDPGGSFVQKLRDAGPAGHRGATDLDSIIASFIGEYVGAPPLFILGKSFSFRDPGFDNGASSLVLGIGTAVQCRRLLRVCDLPHPFEGGGEPYRGFYIETEEEHEDEDVVGAVTSLVERKRVFVLNESVPGSHSTLWPGDRSTAVVSDADATLIIFVPFRESVHISSIIIDAPLASSPTSVRLFVNSKVGFDDVESTEPAALIRIADGDLGQPIKVRPTKFNGVNYLYIYFERADDTRVAVSKLAFIGTAVQKIDVTKLRGGMGAGGGRYLSYDDGDHERREHKLKRAVDTLKRGGHKSEELFDWTKILNPDEWFNEGSFSWKEKWVYEGDVFKGGTVKLRGGEDGGPFACFKIIACLT